MSLVCSRRLAVQDIALSRRRSRVRIPSGVPNTKPLPRCVRGFVFGRSAVMKTVGSESGAKRHPAEQRREMSWSRIGAVGSTSLFSRSVHLFRLVDSQSNSMVGNLPLPSHFASISRNSRTSQGRWPARLLKTVITTSPPISRPHLLLAPSCEPL